MENRVGNSDKSGVVISKEFSTTPNNPSKHFFKYKGSRFGQQRKIPPLGDLASAAGGKFGENQMRSWD